MKKIVAAIALLWCAGAVMAQSVSGVVKDTGGEILVGAAVQVGTRGVFTDVAGKYKLELPAGSHTVVFNYTGYEPQTRTVTLAAGQNLELNVVLKGESTDLDDVVVIGYGVQRKRDVTGSIETVSGKQLTQFPVPSFEAALQGQAAGVQVSQGSGLAGSGSILRIRGIASISAGGDPLYVVDGIPITQNQFLRGNNGAMNNNPLATLNPNDIESVQILKDAAATGIYGSRGANGVVLITTKRGRQPGWNFDFTTRLGVGVAASLPDMLNTEEYLGVRQEAWENDGGTGYVWLPGRSLASDSPETREAAFKEAMKTNTDWIDQTTGTGIKHMYSFGAARAGEKDNFYAGITFDHNGSFLVGNYFERLSGRINYDRNLAKNLKLISSLSISNGKNQRIDAAWSGGMGEAMSTALPYYPVYEQGSEYGGFFMWNNGYSNPVNYIERRPWRTTENRTIAGLSLVYSPLQDLNIKVSGGYDYMDLGNAVFIPQFLNAGERLANRGFGDATWVNNWNASATADYTRTFNQHHRITLLVGGETQRSHTERYENISYFNVNGPAYDNDSETDSTVVAKFIGSPDTWTFISSFARMNYSFKDKYYLQVVARSDGSSKFGENNKFGFFPAVSAGWIISDEEFLRENRTISFLKLRAGWGKTGNADVPGDAQYGTFSAADNGITYNGAPILFPLKLPNPDLRWETSTTLDASLEMRLWKDALQIEVSAYRKSSTDVLMNVSVPASTGFGQYWDNVAEILNQGIELSITSFNINGPFAWKTDFNVARNYNELVSIGNYTPDAVSGGTNDSRVIPGKPVGSFYLMEFSHVDPANGLPVYLDLNGNETYDYDNSQRKYVGDGLPDVIGGITNSFSYKGWDLTILATYSLGAKIFDSSGKRQMGVVTDWNMRAEILDRWQQPGDDSFFPRLTLDETTYSLPSGFPWWNTSLFIFDADYLRLKNIAIGYNFSLKPESRLNSLRVSANVTNLFTITNFPGLDPELVRDFENAQDRNLSPNVTYLTPPQERSYNFSISTTF